MPRLASPPSLTPTPNEVEAEFNWTAVATLSVEQQDNEDRWEAEDRAAAERAQARKARALVERLAAATPPLPDQDWRPVSAPPDVPEPAPAKRALAMSQSIAVLRAPSPVSASERARIDNYLAAAARSDKLNIDRIPLRSQAFVVHDVFDGLELDDGSLDILAEAASREAPLDEGAADDDDDDADAAALPLFSEPSWDDHEASSPLCEYCLFPFGDKEQVYDAAYKRSELNLGPLHYDCAPGAFEKYHERVTGRLPNTQCTIVKMY